MSTRCKYTVVDHASPVRVIEVRELGERIQHTLDCLPPEYRILLLLVADQDLSCREVAELAEQTIVQELLPAIDRNRRVLAYEMVIATGAVRIIIRESHLHQSLSENSTAPPREATRPAKR